MKLQKEKRRQRQRSASSSSGSDDATQDLSIEEFIPLYLQRFITPYHGDFCFTRVFHYRLVAQLMSEGFLPIATDGVLLPKLHEHRCVVTLPDNLHVSRSVRKKAKRFHITVNTAFDRVVAGCKKQHGRRCWLYPPLVEAFQNMNQQQPGGVPAVVFDKEGLHPTGRECPVRLYSLEVWNASTGALAGGELGYTVGSIYTSLTGFSEEDSAGSVQLAALGRMLCSLGFTLWDLGMEMEYKNSLGCHLMPRKQFLEHVVDVRERLGHLKLPMNGESFDAKSLIDQTEQERLLLIPTTGTAAISSKPESEDDNNNTQNGNHQPPFDQERSPPDKKKQRNSTPEKKEATVHAQPED
jgi:Leu/Phe-tRNA-protein transferase